MRGARDSQLCDAAHKAISRYAPKRIRAHLVCALGATQTPSPEAGSDAKDRAIMALNGDGPINLIISPDANSV